MSPEYEATDAEIFRENTVDFIGCNYYQPLRIQAPLPQKAASGPFEPRQLFRGYDWPEKKSILIAAGKSIQKGFTISRCV